MGRIPHRKRPHNRVAVMELGPQSMAAAMLQELARQLRRAAQDLAVSFPDYMATRGFYFPRLEEISHG